MARSLTRDLARHGDPRVALYELQKLRVRARRLLEGLERITGARPGPGLQVEVRGLRRARALRAPHDVSRSRPPALAAAIALVVALVLWRDRLIAEISAERAGARCRLDRRGCARARGRAGSSRIREPRARCARTKRRRRMRVRVVPVMRRSFRWAVSDSESIAGAASRPPRALEGPESVRRAGVCRCGEPHVGSGGAPHRRAQAGALQDGRLTSVRAAARVGLRAVIDAEGRALGVTTANWLDAPVQPLGLPPRGGALQHRADRARRGAGARAPASRARPRRLRVQLRRPEPDARRRCSRRRSPTGSS